ncbi:flavocytochrome c [Campylobacter sp. RM9344]|uniref:Flavocytochrome c n=1 Tax=Campylobacter californiensis TaxID=1032243 RepID=A0AAW3ZZ90_9BACT|nr:MULTISPECIES: flavocytochrome c [unclassified Campylobacter]MBE2985436.1 flavocytochrome c [Campylobacter sp. RM6883]MBE2987245.1 flavocytochrome c [Campylobacter sp. RM12919]MBE2988996.1 flavocytochrome c [Campylobacter sp. RM12920]MBE2996014.1 flavocytochrome c [Campylobacter sp. RM6913]MBE3030290.1 flavocytochrome c [Campylobacter sp. RM9344]
MEKMSRRDLLKMSMVGASALALGSINSNADTIKSNEVKFDEEYDVVIIGTGFAGSMAALQALKRGLKVALIEKMGRAGGNSVINVGNMAVPNNAFQKAEGIKDSKELFIADCLKDGVNLNHVDLLSVIYDRANEAFEYLKSTVGVEFVPKCISASGHSIKRAVQVKVASGSGYIQPMHKMIEANPNAIIKKRTKFDEFVMEGDRVVGIKCRENYKFDSSLASDDLENTGGDVKYIKAKNGVILAAGGFSSDKWFRAQQVPYLKTNIETVSQPGATAGALLAAMDVGANPLLLSWIQLNPYTNPTEKGFGTSAVFTNHCSNDYGLSINPKTGKRFMNEHAGRKIKCDAIFKVMAEGANNDNYPVNICDQAAVDLNNPLYTSKGVESGSIKKFNTLEELAKAYNIPVEPFLKTVSDFNGYVKAEKDPEFGKPLKQADVHGIDVSKPPFYASLSTPKILYCMGGIQINEKAQVISRKTQKPIAGLYAAGEVTGGIQGGGRLGTMSMSDCMVFGMIAGENI